LERAGELVQVAAAAAAEGEGTAVAAAEAAAAAEREGTAEAAALPSAGSATAAEMANHAVPAAAAATAAGLHAADADAAVEIVSVHTSSYSSSDTAVSATVDTVPAGGSSSSSAIAASAGALPAAQDSVLKMHASRKPLLSVLLPASPQHASSSRIRLLHKSSSINASSTGSGDSDDTASCGRLGAASDSPADVNFSGSCLSTGNFTGNSAAAGLPPTGCNRRTVCLTPPGFGAMLSPNSSSSGSPYAVGGPLGAFAQPGAGSSSSSSSEGMAAAAVSVGCLLGDTVSTLFDSPPKAKQQQQQQQQVEEEA
jgi:hypothetical protein